MVGAELVVKTILVGLAFFCISVFVGLVLALIDSVDRREKMARDSVVSLGNSKGEG